MEDQQNFRKSAHYICNNSVSQYDWLVVYYRAYKKHVLLVLCGPIGTNCNLTQWIRCSTKIVASG